MSNPFRVLLVDDHAVLRAGLRLLLNAETDFEVVGEAGDGRQVLHLVEKLDPDLIILDLTMPGLGGLDTLRSLHKLNPNCRVLVLTMHKDQSYLRRALAAGAMGYVLKQADDQELLVALRAVSRDDIYVPPALAPSILGNLIPQPIEATSSQKTPLSEREEQVLRLVAKGYTSQEVSEQLNLAVTTVETYRSRAMRKLELHGRVQLVQYAIQVGWLSQE